MQNESFANWKFSTFLYHCSLLSNVVVYLHIIAGSEDDITSLVAQKVVVAPDKTRVAALVLSHQTLKLIL